MTPDLHAGQLQARHRSTAHVPSVWRKTTSSTVLRTQFAMLFCCGLLGCAPQDTRTAASPGSPPAANTGGLDPETKPGAEPTGNGTMSDGSSSSVVASEQDPAAAVTNSAGPRSTGSVSQTPAGRTPDTMKVRKRMTVRADGKFDISFDDLEFDIERDAPFERSMLSENIDELIGQTVIVRGFILDASVYKQTGIEQFVLVRDNQECCFGPGAYLYHNIQVQMEPGKSVDFSIRPITVQGRLSIKPFLGPGGKCYSVYQITATSAGG